MLLYKGLYTGEGAERRRSWLLEKMRRGIPPVRLYVIVPPPPETENLLEIYPAVQILGKKEEQFCRIRGSEPLILGIAWGRDEAFLLAGQIVDELYRQTGGFDVETYLNLGEYAGMTGRKNTAFRADDADVTE